MALEPVKLDDLTWNDMVTAIRSRIAADSEGRWTLHAPVDPGITLLELFAWLLEQRLYWMDQVPDSLERAALALLGVDGPKPAQTAATVLTLYDRSQQPQAFRTVGSETKFKPVHTSRPPLVFSTESAFTLLPVLPDQPVTLQIGGVDRTADLRQGRVLRLFPADGSFSEVKLVLQLSDLIPSTPPTEQFTLFFKLRISSDIPSQWSPDAKSDVHFPADISWWYHSKTGEKIQFASVNDGTKGFRRSGIVRFTIPADWQPETNPADIKTKSYAIWIRVNQATFTAPPLLERLEPNACIARNQWFVDPVLGRVEWLPLPGNTISLSDYVKDPADKNYPPLEQQVILKFREHSDPDDPKLWTQWQVAADLTLKRPSDRFFTVNRESRKLLFGDGLAGRMPILFSDPGGKSPNVYLQYLVGGGAVGNLEENLCWESLLSSGASSSGIDAPNLTSSPRTGVRNCSVESVSDLIACNVVPAEGGADSESIASARQRAASQLKRLDRAVTRKDYEEIARTTPGVAIQRAHAAIGYHPCYPCMPVLGVVTVFIVPYAPREDIDEVWVENAFVSAPAPDPGALSAVQNRLENARLVSSEVFIRGPRYRPIAVVAEVEADSLDPVTLKHRIKKGLTMFFDPLVGGDEGLGWPFGEPVRPSALLREIQKVLGKDGEAMGVSITLLDIDQESDCLDVKIGPHDLVELKAFSAQFSRPSKSQGGLL